MENNNKEWEQEVSKDSRNPGNNGNNGNPAQSASRPSSSEQDASPATPERDPLETYPDLMPDSLSHSGKARTSGEPKEGSLESARMNRENNRSPAGENI